MLHDKYNRLIIDKLPKEVAIEFKQIKDDTENFSDEDVMDIYTENFNDLFKIVETKYPEALKSKKKLIKPGKSKITKKAEPKKKIVKKDEAKKKLKKVSELPCDDAKDELKKIESKKAQAVKKRAEAPKKKVSTAAREKQVKTLSSILKMKGFKDSKEAAEKFATDLISAYKKSDFTDLFISNLKEDIDALIESKYNVEKMKDGGQLESETIKPGVYNIGMPQKINDVPTYEQKIVEIFADGTFSTASDYARKKADFKNRSYPTISDEKFNQLVEKMAAGGKIESDVKDETNKLYAKSGFINDDFSWEGKLLEMIQDNSVEAYQIYKSLSKAQKEEVLQYQFEFDNDMGSDGDGEIETSKENLEIMLEDAKNGKTY